MAIRQLINGKCYDWSSVDVNISGSDNIEVSEISYDDEQDAELTYGKGGKPRGWGTGNKKNTVKMTMLREDFNEMTRLAKRLGYSNFYDFVIPKITVSYADDGADTCTDVIKNFKPTKRSFKAANGDKTMSVSVEGFALDIKINGMSA